MKIGITGATGQLGRLVVEKLKERVDPSNLVALVRSPEKAADLGIAVQSFDYSEGDGLAEALAGIDQLLLISGNELGQRAQQHQNVIEAAQASSVQRIVYTSVLHADVSSLSLAAEHLATEKLVEGAGIAYTILRNGWYTENYTASAASSVAAGTILGSAAEGKISSASREDYAEAAAVVLSSEGHEGKVYELAGDQAYTLADLAAAISQQTGKDIPYTNLPEQEYAAILKKVGLPAAIADFVANCDVSASKDALFDDGGVLAQLIGRPTTPMVETLKKAL